MSNSGAELPDDGGKLWFEERFDRFYARMMVGVLGFAFAMMLAMTAFLAALPFLAKWQPLE